ncbi:hypothetical protein AK812_SmicGene48455, partial [Symbiodinium microadriaticum]
MSLEASDLSARCEPVNCRLLELCAEADSAASVEQPVDNRVAWAKKRRHFSRSLELLLALYLAMEDGTCSVERYHAFGSKISDCHKGPLSTTLFSDLLECRVDGPTSLDEVAARRGTDLCLTPWSRAFLVEWRKTHGGRFRIYQSKRVGKKEEEKSKMKKFTQAGLRLRQTMALHKLSARDSAESNTTVLPGVSRAEAASHMCKESTRPTQALSKFNRRTQLIKERGDTANKARKTDGHPFGKPQRITATLFRPQSTPTPQATWLQKFKSLQRWKVLDGTLQHNALVLRY